MHTCTISIVRVLEMSEPESEDEEAIIRRRRELRQAIVQKYQLSQPITEASSLATTPAPSEGSPDIDAVGDEAAKALEELIQEKMKQRVGDEGGESVGPTKTTVPPDEEEERERKKSNLLAVKAAVRNTDMFSEGDIFGEKYLVRFFFFWWLYIPVYVGTF